MTAINTGRQPPSRSSAGAARPARAVYTALAWLFVAGVTVQVFLAGLGTLVDADRWSAHRALGMVLLLLPLAMLVAAIAGRMPRSIIAPTALAIGLIVLQPILIEISAGSAVAFLRALHPVNAFAIFWLAVDLTRRARLPG
jgi:hypothetical protein